MFQMSHSSMTAQYFMKYHLWEDTVLSFNLPRTMAVSIGGLQSSVHGGTDTQTVSEATQRWGDSSLCSLDDFTQCGAIGLSPWPCYTQQCLHRLTKAIADGWKLCSWAYTPLFLLKIKIAGQIFFVNFLMTFGCLGAEGAS